MPSLLKALSILLTFGYISITKPKLTVSKKTLYEKTYDTNINQALLTNASQPRIVIATDDKISVINPFVQNHVFDIDMSNKGPINGKIFKDRQGIFAYLTFKNFKENFLLTIDFSTSSYTTKNIQQEELIGISEGHLIFKDTSKNKIHYYPVIIKNIKSGDTTILNGLSESARDPQKAFLLSDQGDKEVIMNSTSGMSLSLSRNS